MRPITVELSPSEALHLIGVLGVHLHIRQQAGKPYQITARLEEKVNRAILDATAREDAAK